MTKIKEAEEVAEKVGSPAEPPTPHVFVQTLNPMRGKMEWKPKPVDYDYKQELARAAFADMLHDTERNHLYYVGLEAAIKKKRREGQKVHVLDIGTGTGLLSMMAVSLGADTVTAIEEFSPMSECADRVMRLNGCREKVHLIRKRSTAVRVGPGGDMAERANVLVTEVFDTELIGEGAISTFNLAHKHLLTTDCEVVPCEATVYVQLVESDLADRWNGLRNLDVVTTAAEEAADDEAADDEAADDEAAAAVRVQVRPPPQCDATSSSASLALHDVQMSQMKPQWFNVLTQPITVFKFDFGPSSGGRIPRNEQTVRVAELMNCPITPKSPKAAAAEEEEAGIKCSAVLMWWDIWMDPDKTVLLSCAPVWAHPNRPKKAADLPWRDHWMQAIYYPVTPLRRPSISPPSRSENRVTVVSNHDEYSYWFDVWQGDYSCENIPQLPMPDPSGAGVHLAVSRARLGQINDVSRNRKLASAIGQLVDSITRHEAEDDDKGLNVLCLSEQSLLPVIFAAVYEQKVKKDAAAGSTRRRANIYVCSKNDRMYTVLTQYFDSCGFSRSANLVAIDADVSEISLPHLPAKVDMVIGEPNFSFSLLPWHNLYFWYSLHSLTVELQGGLEVAPSKKEPLTKCKVMPKRATLWALPVHYRDLWKIRAPVGTTEGFNLQPFDELIMQASDGCDENVEPHPLWEYPCTALGTPQQLAVFDLTSPIKDTVKQTPIPFHPDQDHDLNGMALWMDWHLTDQVTITTGPVDKVVVGQEVSWDVHSKQGVHLFPKHRTDFVESPKPTSQHNISTTSSQLVKCDLTFDAKEGDVLFGFSVMSS